MNNFTRQEKIDLLRAIVAGSNPRLPEPATSITWQYDGILFIEQGPLQQPRKRGLKLNKTDFTQYISEHRLLRHLVFDETGELAAVGFNNLRALKVDEYKEHSPFLAVWRDIISLIEGGKVPSPLPQAVTFFIP